MSIPLGINTLFSSGADTTVVTPNRRLAAYLKKEHADFCGCSKNYWETPDILPLSGWLLRLFTQLEDRGQATSLLLSPLQEWVLWWQTLQAELGEQPVDIKSRVRLVQDAWKTIRKWEVCYTHPDFLLGNDTAFFASCASRFCETCEQNKWLSEAKLPEILLQQLKTENLPARLVLFAFDEIYPELHLLLKKLRSLGVLVIEYHPPKKDSLPVRVKAPEPESETILAARFALYHHLANPGSRVAVIVPELGQNWGKMNTLFKQVFQENLALPEPCSFSISAGTPLIYEPVIRSALFLFRLVQSKLVTHELIELVRSPYGMAAKTGLTAIDDFVSFVIKSRQTHWTLAELPSSLYKPVIQKITRKLSCFEWTGVLYQCLQMLGWPGERALESGEYQTIDRFKSVLEEISQADTILREPVRFEIYDQLLTHVLETTVFQPESSDAKVQVLGILEAAGQSFEKIWVTGLSQSHWPPPCRPNPFIPHSLQRELLMPHASPQRELSYAKRVLEDFCRSAEEIIFSWPGMNSDEPLLPSSLITFYKEIDLTEIPQGPLKEPQFDLFEQYAQHLEVFENFHTHPMNKNVLKGGAGLLKDISACPFKAFGRHRLNAKAPDPQTMELTPQEKGTLLHAILAGIWGELKDLEALKQCNDLNAFIEGKIESTFLRYANLFEKREAYRLLEKERYGELVKNELLLEKERPAFRVVALEQEQTFSLGGVEIHLRIDRIDELPNGDWLLLDYKSGVTALKDCFGERPLAPQLPLYALANPKVKAIAFAEISARAIKWVGVSNVPTGINGVVSFCDCGFKDASNWENQLDFWKKLFEQMINQFRNGIALASPALKRVCQVCDFMTLCRNYENLR